MNTLIDGGVGDTTQQVSQGQNETQGTPPLYVRYFPETSPKPLRCLIPASIDLDQLCETAPGGDLWPAKHRHKLAFVLHAIIRGSFERHHSSQCDSRPQGAPLNAALLQRLLGKGKSRDFGTEAVRTLLAWGVIDQCGTQRAGHHSRSYRVSESHRHAPLVWRSFDAPKLVEKLRAHDLRATEEATSAFPVFAQIHEHLKSVTLSAAGRTQALARIANLDNRRKQAAWELSLDALNVPAGRLHYSHESGRVYHCVANCPKELRRHLLIDGEPTAEVDISSSQFFLLLGLYLGPSVERTLYADAVSNGKFYEILKAMADGVDSLAGWHTGDGQAERNAFKEHAIRKLLYERFYRDTATVRVWQAFQGCFPELASDVMFRRLTKNDVRAFCCEMQRREAELVLHKAIPRIHSEIPGCRPLPIHDGILCQRRFASAVAAVLKDEGTKLYHVEPAVKTTFDP